MAKLRDLSVIITPLNENQELNYQESFTGTSAQILMRSLEMIRGLKNVLPKGSFTVKLEHAVITSEIFVVASGGDATGGIYDRDFKLLCEFKTEEKNRIDTILREFFS